MMMLWTTTDRVTLQTKVLPVDEFVKCLVGMLKKLLVHDFTAKMQSTFLQQKKESLQEGEFVVIADFSKAMPRNGVMLQYLLVVQYSKTS